MCGQGGDAGEPLQEIQGGSFRGKNGFHFSLNDSDLFPFRDPLSISAEHLEDDPPIHRLEDLICHRKSGQDPVVLGCDDGPAGQRAIHERI